MKTWKSFWLIGAALMAQQPTQIKSAHYHPARLSRRYSRGRVKGTFAVRTLRSLAGTNWRGNP